MEKQAGDLILEDHLRNRGMKVSNNKIVAKDGNSTKEAKSR